MNGRWVVLGGTFDPIHVGHLSLIRGAVEHLGAEQGVLVVDRGHGHRSAPVLSHADRASLAREASDSVAGVGEAGELGLAGRLVEVVGALAARGHDVHVVFGSDSADRLACWGGDVALTSHATVWSVPRSGCPVASGFPTMPLTVPGLSSTEIRRLLADGRTVAGLVPPAIEPRLYQRFGVLQRA